MKRILILAAACSALAGCNKQDPAQFCARPSNADDLRSMINEAAERAFRTSIQGSVSKEQGLAIGEAIANIEKSKIFVSEYFTVDSYDDATGNLTCYMDANYLMPMSYDKVEAKRLASMMQNDTIHLKFDALDQGGSFRVKFKLSDDLKMPKGNHMIIGSDDMANIISFNLFRIMLEAERISKEHSKSTHEPPLVIGFN